MTRQVGRHGNGRWRVGGAGAAGRRVRLATRWRLQVVEGRGSTRAFAVTVRAAC